jgi:hypothetical protein
MRTTALIGLALASGAACYSERHVVRTTPTETTATTSVGEPVAAQQRIVVIRSDGRRQEGVVISRDPISGRALVRVPDEDRSVSVSSSVVGRTTDSSPRVIVREERVVVPDRTDRVVVGDRERRTYVPTQRSDAFASWVRNNPDAAEAFCGWAEEDQNAAAALLKWEADHPQQARELINWAVEHPNGTGEQYVKAHPGIAGEELLRRLANSTSGLLDWARSFPRAAEALTERPRALASAATTNSCG